MELNRKKNNMNNIPTHVSNDSTPLDMPFDKCTTVIIEDSQVKPYSIFGGIFFLVGKTIIIILYIPN